MNTIATSCPTCHAVCQHSDRYCHACGAGQNRQVPSQPAATDLAAVRTGSLIIDPPLPLEPPIAIPDGGLTSWNVTSAHTSTAVPLAQTIHLNVSPSPVPMVHFPERESSSFAILTLIAYFFIFPLGALMNLIGLICGPRRGCFAAMLFFILVPSVMLGAAAIALAILTPASAGP